MGRLAGKVILVTGGAGGIGRAIVTALAGEGARVVATGRSRAGDFAGDVQFMAQDVTQEDQWMATVKAVVERHGKLDGLVHCAGATVLKPLEEMKPDEMRAMLKANLESSFLALKHAVPAIEKVGGGAVVNIGAMDAMRGAAQATAFGCSKGAQNGLGKSAALEEQARKVRVNAVHPGFVYGASTEATFGKDGAKKVHDSAVSRTPLARAGTVDDIPGIVIFLVSDESKHVTGSDFVVDGGLIAV